MAGPQGRVRGRAGDMDTKLVAEHAAAPIAPDQAATVASVFKAFAEPHRIRIVNLLANAAGPVCVCDFMPQLGLSQGTVSFHLKKLLATGLLSREERGTWAYYSLRPEGVDRLVHAFGTVFDPQEATA